MINRMILLSAFLWAAFGLTVPPLFVQSADVQIWVLPHGTVVKDAGPRSYRFTEVYNTANRTGEVIRRQRLTYAVSEGKAWCVDSAVAQLEKKLNPRQFSRIHRSTLVNVAWIKEVTSLPGGALNIRLKDGKGTDLTVARDRARAFRERMGL
jgi:hypothetical protein